MVFACLPYADLPYMLAQAAREAAATLNVETIVLDGSRAPLLGDECSSETAANDENTAELAARSALDLMSNDEFKTVAIFAENAALKADVERELERQDGAKTIRDAFAKNGGREIHDSGFIDKIEVDSAVIVAEHPEIVRNALSMTGKKAVVITGREIVSFVKSERPGENLPLMPELTQALTDNGAPMRWSQEAKTVNVTPFGSNRTLRLAESSTLDAPAGHELAWAIDILAEIRSERLEATASDEVIDAYDGDVLFALAEAERALDPLQGQDFDDAWIPEALKQPCPPDIVSEVLAFEAALTDEEVVAAINENIVAASEAVGSALAEYGISEAQIANVDQISDIGFFEIDAPEFELAISEQPSDDNDIVSTGEFEAELNALVAAPTDEVLAPANIDAEIEFHEINETDETSGQETPGQAKVDVYVTAAIKFLLETKGETHDHASKDVFELAGKMRQAIDKSMLKDFIKIALISGATMEHILAVLEFRQLIVENDNFRHMKVNDPEGDGSYTMQTISRPTFTYEQIFKLLDGNCPRDWKMDLRDIHTKWQCMTPAHNYEKFSSYVMGQVAIAAE